MNDDINNTNNTIAAQNTANQQESFDIKTHEVMLYDSFEGGDFSRSEVRRMKWGIGFVSDLFLMLKQSVHLDNHRGNDCMVKAYKGAIDGFHQKISKRKFICAGVKLHTIGDFYAHSNYIDLYSLYAQQKKGPMEKDDIPGFSQLMDDADFLAFAKTQGELRTGTYGMISDLIEKIFKTKPKPGSHTVMNLDSNKSINGGKPFAPGADFTKHEAGVYVATKECKLLLQRLL